MQQINTLKKILSYLVRITLAVISSVGLYALIFIVLAVSVFPSWVLGSFMNETAITVIVIVLILLIIRQAYAIYLEDKELKNTENISVSLEQQRVFLIFDNSMKNYFSENKIIQQVAKLQLQKLKEEGKFVAEIDRILSGYQD